MSNSLQVDIVSAEGHLFSGTAELLVASAEQGEIGVAPLHTPLLTRLTAGEVRVINQGQEEQQFYVSGGILEIQPHMVTVLADAANRAADLSEAQAQQAKQRAEEALANQSAEIDYAKAKTELAEAVAQLRVIERLRKAGR